MLVAEQFDQAMAEFENPRYLAAFLEHEFLVERKVGMVSKLLAAWLRYNDPRKTGAGACAKDAPGLDERPTPCTS